MKTSAIDWAALRQAAIAAARAAGARRAAAEDAAHDALEIVLGNDCGADHIRDLDGYVRRVAQRLVMRDARRSERERQCGLELDWLVLDDAIDGEARADARRALALVGASSDGGADTRLAGSDGRSRVWRHRLWRVVTVATGVCRPPQGLKAGGPGASSGAPTRRSGSPEKFPTT